MSSSREGRGVQLLEFWACPFGQRCRIALAEKGVKYEYKEQKLPIMDELLLKSNPIHKLVPVLLHGDRPVCESLIIVQYIDETWPARTDNFLPSNRYARAQARFWAEYVDKKVYECGSRLWKLEGEARAKAKVEFIEILRTLEGVLGNQKYFGGDTFGLVDIALVPFTAWFLTYELYSGFSVERECPKIVKWANHCKKRESVAKALHDPLKIYEYVRFLREIHTYSIDS